MKSGRWMGPGRVLLCTRAGRRAGDPGRVLRDLSRGADTAVGLCLRGRPALLLLDPDLAGQLLVELAPHSVKGPGVQRTRALLGEGLLTSEGDIHRRARRLVAYAFSPRRLAGYVDAFGECAARTSGRWSDGQEVDMHAEMAALTLAMVGRTLFGVDLTAETADIRESLESSLAAFAGGGSAMPGRRTATRGPSESAEEVAARNAPVHRFIDGVIAERRLARRTDRPDVVSALIANAEGPTGLSDTEIHDHLMTLLMAGHETTANALTWTLHLLGEHPEVERRLHDEVDALQGGAPSFDQLAGLTYTRAVVSEALRLYPPAWIMGRTLTEAADFGAWHVPAGAFVGVSPLLMHRDTRWFPQPEHFQPDRWLDERRERVPRNAFIPFGTGPRSCIGEQFAWAEAVTAIAVLTSRWTARTDPGHVPVPQYRVTLPPAGGMPMRVHRREMP